MGVIPELRCHHAVGQRVPFHEAAAPEGQQIPRQGDQCEQRERECQDPLCTCPRTLGPEELPRIEHAIDRSYAREQFSAQPDREHRGGDQESPVVVEPQETCQEQCGAEAAEAEAERDQRTGARVIVTPEQWGGDAAPERMGIQQEEQGQGRIEEPLAQYERCVGIRTLGDRCHVEAGDECGERHRWRQVSVR